MRRICRGCLLCEPQDYVNLHIYIEEFEEKLTYVECFQHCTQLSIKPVEDTFLEVEDSCTEEQVICVCCAGELKNAYKFIRKAQESDRKLRSKCVVKIEEEVPEKSEIFEWVAVQKEEVDIGSDDNCLAELPIIDKLETINKCSNSEETQTHSQSEDMLTQSEVEKETGETIQTITANDSHTESNDDEEFQPLKMKVISCTKRNRGRPRKTDVETDTKQEPQQKSSGAQAQKVQEAVCEYCDKCLPRKELKRHLRLEHKHRPLLCQACPRTFSDIFNLRQHERIHAKDRERNFICDQCGKKFFTYVTYKNHIKIHDNSRKAVFHCDTCGKSFMHKGSLTLHRQKHTGPKIECKVCERRFVRLADYEVHLRTHSGDLPFKCLTCDKAFTQSSSLNRHLRQHEGFRYKCDICGKDYEHQSTLKQHRAGHIGLPFQCVRCGKGFAHKYRITRHIRTVHKIKEENETEKLIVRNKTAEGEGKEGTAEES